MYSLECKSIQYKIPTNNIGVRTFAQSPDGKTICIIDEEGTLTLNELKHGTSADLIHQETCVVSHDYLQTFSRLIDLTVVRDYVKFGCKVCWHPTNPNLLAVPSTDGAIVFLCKEESSSKWVDRFLTGDHFLSHELHSLNVVQFSPDGLHLASADSEGVVLLWRIDDVLNPQKATPLSELVLEGDLIASTQQQSEKGVVDLVWGQRPGDSHLLVVTSSCYSKVELNLSNQPKMVAAAEAIIASATAEIATPSNNKRRVSFDPLTAAEERPISQEDFLPTQSSPNPIFSTPTVPTPMQAPRKRLSNKKKQNNTTSNNVSDADDLPDLLTTTGIMLIVREGDV